MFLTDLINGVSILSDKGMKLFTFYVNSLLIKKINVKHPINGTTIKYCWKLTGWSMVLSQVSDMFFFNNTALTDNEGINVNILMRSILNYKATFVSQTGKCYLINRDTKKQRIEGT